jgi:hypothetical protein
MLQTVMRASLIQLHGLFASTSVESYSKVVAAAHEIVNVAKTLQNVSEIYWQVPIHVSDNPPFVRWEYSFIHGRNPPLIGWLGECRRNLLQRNHSRPSVRVSAGEETRIRDP